MVTHSLRTAAVTVPQSSRASATRAADVYIQAGQPPLHELGHPLEQGDWRRISPLLSHQAPLTATADASLPRAMPFGGTTATLPGKGGGTARGSPEQRNSRSTKQGGGGGGAKARAKTAANAMMRAAATPPHIVSTSIPLTSSPEPAA